MFRRPGAEKEIVRDRLRRRKSTQFFPDVKVESFNAGKRLSTGIAYQTINTLLEGRKIYKFPCKQQNVLVFTSNTVSYTHLDVYKRQLKVSVVLRYFYVNIIKVVIIIKKDS